MVDTVRVDIHYLEPCWSLRMAGIRLFLLTAVGIGRSYRRMCLGSRCCERTDLMRFTDSFLPGNIVSCACLDTTAILTERNFLVPHSFWVGLFDQRSFAWPRMHADTG